MSDQFQTIVYPALTIPENEEFVSDDQVITTAGALTLTHDLKKKGVAIIPKRINYFLICQIAEQGYLVGDIVTCNPMGVFVQNTFMTIKVDKTNLKVKYGNQVDVFRFLNINTGNGATAIDTSWKVRFIASRI